MKLKFLSVDFRVKKTRVPKKVALQLPLHCGGVYHQRRWLDVQINAVQKTKWDLQTPWCCFLSYDWNSIGKKPVSSQWLLESWKNHEQKPWIILADVKKTDKCVTISTVRGRHWLFFLNLNMFNHLIFQFARESRYNNTVDLRDTVDNNLVCQNKTCKWWDKLINYLWTGAGFRPSTVCNIDSIWANYYPNAPCIGLFTYKQYLLRRCRFVFSYDGGFQSYPQPPGSWRWPKIGILMIVKGRWSSHYTYICMIYCEVTRGHWKITTLNWNKAIVWESFIFGLFGCLGYVQGVCWNLKHVLHDGFPWDERW